MSIEHGVEINQPKPGNVLVVARDWGEVEVELQRPLVGPAGILHDDVASFGGFRRQDLNFANVVPETRPPEDDFRRHNPQDVANGRLALDRLVKRLKPSLIITMGNEASYHFVPDWPTNGRDIFGAKGIEDRRGYFWETKYGWVYTILHPAGAARKIVPGYELLRRDWKRAKSWLRGRLPRTEFPTVQTLTSHSQVRHLQKSKILCADIETRYGKKVFCCGFCGDDKLPYVAKFGQGFGFMRTLLGGVKGQRGGFHNGQYDADILDREDYPTALFTDDTQTMWGNGLEPELAFRDEEDKGRLTRKGLASLASICPTLNVPFWKAQWARSGHPEWIAGYPPEETSDKNELAKLYTMGGRDAFVTRWIFDWLWAEILKLDREPQYRLAFETNLRCITMTRRGWPVNDKLRKERIKTLHARAEAAKEVSQKAALAFIQDNEIERFKITKECECCSGVGERCWRCAGLGENPKRKEGFLGAQLFLDDEMYIADEELLAHFTAKEIRNGLVPCKMCEGRGNNSHYEFNPFSRTQQMALIYDYIGAPKWTFKGKDKFDEMATIKLMLWAREEGK